MDGLNAISHDIIKGAIEVHKELGPGLLESVYRKCLSIQLREMGYEVLEEVYIPLEFHGQLIEEKAFRIDLLVNSKIIVELKSVEKIPPLYSKQLGTYLKLAGKHLGLLINFNEVLLKNGIKRIVNGFED